MQILGDFTTSVKRALGEIDPNYESYEGVVVCGTHSPHDIDKLITAITEAREKGTPFLGICFGHQLAAIEYARNVLGIKEATSEELRNPSFSTGYEYIVRKLPKLNVGLKDGETYWHNYEVIPEFYELWKKEENFITVQYHPEYQSSMQKPHTILVKFLQLCKK